MISATKRFGSTDHTRSLAAYRSSQVLASTVTLLVVGGATVDDRESHCGAVRLVRHETAASSWATRSVEGGKAPMMNVLIVHESMFGNTRTIASAVADGLHQGRSPDDGAVRLVHVDDAPTVIPADVALLLVGGPTHALGMTRPRTRQDALTQGATAAGHGVREWIQAVTPRPELRVVTFDTRVHVT